jgi:hypothetical protein
MAGEKGHFVLFDDAGSLRKKLSLARELGITTVFLPYEDTADLLEELLGEKKPKTGENPPKTWTGASFSPPSQP